MKKIIDPRIYTAPVSYGYYSPCRFLCEFEDLEGIAYVVMETARDRIQKTVTKDLFEEHAQVLP